MKPADYFRVRLKDGRQGLVVDRSYVVEIGPWDEHGIPAGGVEHVSDEEVVRLATPPPVYTDAVGRAIT